MREWKNILFVGNDNTFLSRFAEEYFNNYAIRYGLEMKAVSRGLNVTRINPEHRQIKRVVLNELRMRGMLPIQADRLAEKVNRAELNRYDYIYVMDQNQLDKLRKLIPQTQGHIECLNVQEDNEEFPEIELKKLSEKIDDIIN